MEYHGILMTNEIPWLDDEKLEFHHHVMGIQWDNQLDYNGNKRYGYELGHMDTCGGFLK